MITEEKEIINKYQKEYKDIIALEQEKSDIQTEHSHKINVLEKKIKCIKETIPQKVKNIIAKNKMCNADSLQEWGKYCVENMSLLGADFKLYGGGCSKCGEYITALTLQFYNYDVERVLCYKCQNNN